MSNTKTEAQRLADELEKDKWHVTAVTLSLASDELRRLDAENYDLRERNAALGNAQEIALDTATEHALRADELRDRLAAAEAERDKLRAQLSKAVAEEREACAKVCESEPERLRGDGIRAADQLACAAAIRARSNT